MKNSDMKESKFNMFLIINGISNWKNNSRSLNKQEYNLIILLEALISKIIVIQNQYAQKNQIKMIKLIEQGLIIVQ